MTVGVGKNLYESLDGTAAILYDVHMNYRALETVLANGFGKIASYDEILPRKVAEAAYGIHRSKQNFACTPGQLLSTEVDKLKKGDGVALVMLALAPAELSGYNVCPFSTPGCRKYCVAFAGNGNYPMVTRARIARSTFLMENPEAFLSLLCILLDGKLKKGQVAVRLNGFSDIRWERVLPAWFWERYSDVTFYDYTKHSVVSRPPSTMPSNYTLTYSVTERTSEKVLKRELAMGRNVAMVVPTRGGKRSDGTLRELPSFDRLIVDGDANDRRFDDPAGAIVFLRRKGSLPVDDPLVVGGERLRELCSVTA